MVKTFSIVFYAFWSDVFKSNKLNQLNHLTVVQVILHCRAQTRGRRGRRLYTPSCSNISGKNIEIKELSTKMLCSKGIFSFLYIAISTIIKFVYNDLCIPFLFTWLAKIYLPLNHFWMFLLQGKTASFELSMNPVLHKGNKIMMFSLFIIKAMPRRWKIYKPFRRIFYQIFRWFGPDGIRVHRPDVTSLIHRN